MATGTGKTVCFMHLAKHFADKGRILVVADRGELIYQAADHAKRITGEIADVEMGIEWATSHDVFKSKVVVSTIQTQNSGMNGDGRMSRFDPHEFSLLIVDEAHKSVTMTCKRLIKYYKINPYIKILGVTATSDRTDKKALGQVFESVGYEYDILDGINNGWLVPIEQRVLYIKELNFAKIDSTKGDFVGKQLAEVMEDERPIHEVACGILEYASDKKTLVFAASVAHAKRMAEILNRPGNKPNSARFVCGKTDSEKRKGIVADFREGKFQYLINVGCFTHGLDVPDIEVIAMARPTKSRSFYSQCLGRGTRTLAGLVDGVESAEERRQLISQSDKPCMTIIDFTGNAGRHKLIHAVDILGGNYDDELVEIAHKNIEKSAVPLNPLNELQKAEQEFQKARREREEAADRDPIIARALYSTAKVNPFDVLDVTPWREKICNKGRRPTLAMTTMLEKSGVDTSGLSFTHASQMIEEIIRRREEGSPTFKQRNLLRKFKYNPNNYTCKGASELIDQLAKNGWRRIWPKREKVT